MTTFVLLPGLDGTGELFAGITRSLAPLGRVVVMRYPPDRVQTYVELVAQVLHDWPPDDDTVIVAESFSGPVALMVASRPPASLRAVVLSATFARNPTPYLWPTRFLLSHVSPAWLPLRVVESLMLGRHATPQWRETIRRVLARVSAAALSSRALAALDIDVRDALPRIDLPLLYLRAKHDRTIAPRYGDEIVALARDARLVDIDAPHFLLQVAPDAAVAAIEDFLRLRRPQR